MIIDGSLNLVVPVSVLLQHQRCYFKLRASKKELSELSKILNADCIRLIHASGSILADNENRYILNASLKVELVQKCVLSLKPVKTKIEEKIERYFSINQKSVSSKKKIHVSTDSSTIFEEPVQKEFQVGAIVLEETSLNVPDYPKRLGAKFEGVTVTKEGIGPLETVTNKPFIGLERLLTK